MRFPSSSCPVSYGLSGMDRRQSTSRNEEENGAADDANAHLTTIHPQRSPPIVQRPTRSFNFSQEDSRTNRSLNLDPCGSFSAGKNTAPSVAISTRRSMPAASCLE